MRRIETSLAGLLVFEPDVFVDERGFFFESYNAKRWRELGIVDQFVQDNHSKSVRGTLRGLHYQLEHAQAKLCRVVQGEVLDVAVDIRRGSPTFGRYESVVLSAANRLQIYLPEGFAHGFVVLSETAEFLYKCSDFYYREHERGIAWNDPAIGIEWGIDPPILSARDREHPTLAEVPESDLPVFGKP